MSAKFTPGPWVAERRNGYHDVVPEEGDVVARVHDVMDGDGGFSNAALIAAAPDLYAVLLEHLAWYQGRYVDEEDIVRRTRAALAKARGE